jgi:ABC-type phosphate/phosphonate transport system substrate-binding protein
MVRSRGCSSFYAIVLGLSLLLQGATAVGGESIFGPQGVRIGYSSRLLFEVSLQDAQTAMALWTRELNRLAGLNVPPRATIFEGMPTLVAAIQGGEVDFIALSCLDYMKIRERVSIEPALVGLKGERSGDEMVLLVHRGSGIERLGQLKGKRLNLMAGGNEIASLWLNAVLAKKEMPAARLLFGSMKEVGKAQQAILPVFFRQVDACVVNRSAFRTVTELNPQIGRDLSVLAASAELPTGITCFHPDLSEAEKKEFIRISMKRVDSPVGRQILTLF